MRDETDKLLQELGAGALGRSTVDAEPAQPAGTAPGEAEQDRRRILLVEVVYYLNACFRDVQYWEGIKAEKDSFNQLSRVLQQLRELPRPGTSVRIERRGTVLGRGPERPDFEIACADISIDTAAVAAVIKRMGIRFKHLEGRLLKSFETFAAEGIEALTLAIPDETPESSDILRASLRVLSCFRSAIEKGSPITFTLGAEPHSLSPVRDEKGQPDPNLTLLAAVNRQPGDAIEEIVGKVAALMQRPEGAQLKRRFPNVYQALFAIKSVSARLQKAPIEINPARRTAPEPRSAGGWSGPAGAAPAGYTASPGAPAPSTPGAPAAAPESGPAGAAASPLDGTVAPGPGAGPAQAGSPAAAPARVAMTDAELQSGLTPYLATAFAGDPGGAALAVSTLAPQALAGMDADGLGERLGVVSRMLEAMARNPAGTQVLEAISERIEDGMASLPPDVLDGLNVQGNRITTWDGEQEKAIGEAGEQLAGAIEKAKSRAATARRMRAPAAGEEPLYLTRNVQGLAQFLDIPLDDLEAILRIFRGCFDARGNFQKTAFEKRVPEFAQFPKQVFRVCWEFLKDMPRRSDRLPFLNSLQLMIKEIRQPIQAVGTVLADFVADPAQVAYPDRNAMMLATQFLRTYSKEINVDIELTPEEILLVKAGLDMKVVNYAGWKIRGDQKRFLSKLLTVRRRILSALDPAVATPSGGAMPLRFLLALEREVHIFVAVTGGDTAASILCNAIAVYGNPEAPFYPREDTRPHLPALLQHVSVLVRGMARVGTEADLIVLDQLRQREKEFLRLAPDPRHAGLVRRVFSLVEPARSEIAARVGGGKEGL